MVNTSPSRDPAAPGAWRGAGEAAGPGPLSPPAADCPVAWWVMGRAPGRGCHLRGALQLAAGYGPGAKAVRRCRPVGGWVTGREVCPDHAPQSAPVLWGNPPWRKPQGPGVVPARGTVQSLGLDMTAAIPWVYPKSRYPSRCGCGYEAQLPNTHCPLPNLDGGTNRKPGPPILPAVS